MALLDDNPELDLYDREWLIHTRSEERAPAKIGPTAQVHRSLISHGCVINGTVVNSVLSPGVRVDVGAVVRDSIVMFDTVIRTGAVVDRAILDKEVVVGQGAIVGDGPDFDTPNKQEPGRLNTGHHGRRQAVGRPARDARSGRNVKVGEKVKSADFTARTVRSGGTVDRKPRAAQAGAARRRRRATCPRERAHGAVAPGGRDRGRPRRGAVPGPRVDCPPCPSAPRASACAPADVEAWLAELGPGAPGARRPRGRHVVGPRPRRAPPCRAPDHAHPRPGARADLLGALRAADQRQLPPVVPQAAALERRAAVRQVLGRRGRAPAARRRDARRRRRPRTRWGSRSRASSRSPTGYHDGRPSSGSRPAAGATDPPSPAQADGPGDAPARPLRRRSWPSCWSPAGGHARDGAPARRPRADGPRAPSIGGLALALRVASWRPVAGLVRRRSPARAADTDLTLVTDATYTVQPGGRAASGVVVAIAARNHTPRDADPQVLLRPRLPRRPARRRPTSRISGPKGAPVRVARADRGRDAAADRLRVAPLQRRERDDQLAFDLAGPGKAASRAGARRQRASSRSRSGPSRPTAPAGARSRCGSRRATTSRSRRGELRAADHDGRRRDRARDRAPRGTRSTFFAYVSGAAAGGLRGHAARP